MKMNQKCAEKLMKNAELQLMFTFEKRKKT